MTQYEFRENDAQKLVLNYQETSGQWAELLDDAQQGDFQTSMILRGSKISQEQIQTTFRWSGHNFQRAGSDLTTFCPVQGITFQPYEVISSLLFNSVGADQAVRRVAGLQGARSTALHQDTLANAAHEPSSMVIWKALEPAFWMSPTADRMAASSDFDSRLKPI